MVGIRRRGDDAAPGVPFPSRPDDFQPDAHVRAGLGAICRDGDLFLGRLDSEPRAASAVEERRVFPEAPRLLKRLTAASGGGSAREASAHRARTRTRRREFCRTEFAS